MRFYKVRQTGSGQIRWATSNGLNFPDRIEKEISQEGGERIWTQRATGTDKVVKFVLGTETEACTWKTSVGSGGWVEPYGQADGGATGTLEAHCGTVFAGVSELYPAVWPSANGANEIGWGSREGTFGLKNVVFEKDQSTDSGSSSNTGKILLLGECKFAGVIVGSGDTLDIDGQRIYTTGAVDVNGNLMMGAGMWHAGADFDLTNATVSAGQV